MFDYHTAAEHADQIANHPLSTAWKFLTSTDSHESDCGYANHPANCRCDTYDLGIVEGSELGPQNF